MTDTDQEKRERDVLAKMLATKPTPHKALTDRQSGKVTRPKNERVTPVID